VEVRARYEALDGLRGMAAALVVLLHIDWSNHLTDNNFVKNGYLAVDLFFLLSGFVIAANYSTRIASFDDLGKFLVVRVFRLYPLHFSMLSVFVAIECAKLAANSWLGVQVGDQAPFTKHNSPDALLANVLLIQGLHFFAWPTWNGPSWSISCEFAAYVIFGFTFLCRAINNQFYVVLGVVTSIAAYLGAALIFRTLDVTTDWGVVRCLAGFFLGTWLFEISKRGTLVPKFGEIAIGTLVLVVMAFATGWVVVLTVPLFALLILAIQTDQGPVAWLLCSRPARFLGRISYSVYMVHQFYVVMLLIALKRFSVGPLFVNAEGRTIVGINPWLGDGLALLLIGSTLATATVTFAYIEEPGRLFGRRLVKFKGLTIAKEPV
jgi:peptidoglycan/LPS O-acetylase OafA/YrhL